MCNEQISVFWHFYYCCSVWLRKLKLYTYSFLYLLWTPPTLSLILPFPLEANSILRCLCVYLTCVFTLVHTYLSIIKIQYFLVF